MGATPNSHIQCAMPIEPARAAVTKPVGRVSAALVGLLLLLAGNIPGRSQPVNPTAADSPETRFLNRARAAFDAAQERHRTEPDSAEAAWKLAKTGFELADLVDSKTERARIAEFGIRACRKWMDHAECPVGIPYYLALNLGQLARTKTLGALTLVREMEDAFLVAIKMDESFANAGPPRCLGLLYRDAPGWPASIGNSEKARAHLERAVDLHPTFPDNRLCLIESALEWKDIDLLERHMHLYRILLPHARTRFSGETWAESWHSWDQRWKKVQAKASSLIDRPR